MGSQIYSAHHLAGPTMSSSTSPTTSHDAVTIISSPGQSTREIIASIFIALLLPGAGVIRALNVIYRHSIFVGDPIQQAIRVGALCMVVKKA